MRCAYLSVARLVVRQWVQRVSARYAAYQGASRCSAHIMQYVVVRSPCLVCTRRPIPHAAQRIAAVYAAYHGSSWVLAHAMQYEVTRPSKRLWDRPFVVHALHCAALVRSDCVRHARDCRCSRTKFSVRNRLVAEVWVWLIGSLCRACAVCVGSIAANVLASGTCVWAGQWHKSSASWSRRLTRVDGTVAQNERVLVRCGASHVTWRCVGILHPRGVMRVVLGILFAPESHGVDNLFVTDVSTCSWWG